MQKFLWAPLGVAIALVVMLFAGQWLLRGSLATAEVSYSRFEDGMRQGQFSKVVVDDETLLGELHQPEAGILFLRARRIDPALYDHLSAWPVDIEAAPQHRWLVTVLSWVVPVLMFMVLWWGLLRSAIGQHPPGSLLGLARRAPLRVERDTGVRLADVAGVDEAARELREIVDFLRDPAPYVRLGAHIPRGVLLVGPPGTGKTLLARAIAGEAGVPFFSMGGAEFMELFVGVGAARVRDLFAEAKQAAPSIIFIDELDALGRMRGLALSAGHDEREQTLDQLLSEMDGFDRSQGVVVLAATNRPEILDPALLRAGRFDRHVVVDKPDRRGRQQILAVHVRAIRLQAGVSLADIAAMTTGFSGADLANLVNEAALMAARRGASEVTSADVVAAFERMLTGIEQVSRVIPAAEKRVIALHELGHALVGMALRPEDPVQKVSIIPRSTGALGHTLQRPSDDERIAGRTTLLHRLAVLLGGRAAELLCLSEPSTGAADDLARATDLVTRMVTEFGMAPGVGLLALRPRRLMLPEREGDPGVLPWGDAMAARSTQAMQGLLEEALTLASSLLTRHRGLLEELAVTLVERETLGEIELAAIAARLRAVSPTTNPPGTAADGESMVAAGPAVAVGESLR